MSFTLLPPIVAAGAVVDSLGREWDPLEHPRGRDGKFIHTFKRIRAFLDGVSTDPWMTGEVTKINGDGTIRVRVTKTVDPNIVDPSTGQSYVGNEVDISSENVESINEKAILDLDGSEATAPKPVTQNLINAYGFDEGKSSIWSSWDSNVFSDLASGLGKTNASEYVNNFLSSLKNGQSIEEYDADFKANGGHDYVAAYGKYMIANRLRYWRNKDNEAIAGSKNDSAFRGALGELGVDNDVLDDTPDGMSGVQFLADELNQWKKPANAPDADLPPKVGREVVPNDPNALREMEFGNGYRIRFSGEDFDGTDVTGVKISVQDEQGMDAGHFPDIASAKAYIQDVIDTAVPETNNSEPISTPGPNPPPEPEDLVDEFPDVPEADFPDDAPLEDDLLDDEDLQSSFVDIDTADIEDIADQLEISTSEYADTYAQSIRGVTSGVEQDTYSLEEARAELRSLASEIEDEADDTGDASLTRLAKLLHAAANNLGVTQKADLDEPGVDTNPQWNDDETLGAPDDEEDPELKLHQEDSAADSLSEEQSAYDEIEKQWNDGLIAAHEAKEALQPHIQSLIDKRDEGDEDAGNLLVDMQEWIDSIGSEINSDDPWAEIVPDKSTSESNDITVPYNVSGLDSINDAKNGDRVWSLHSGNGDTWKASPATVVGITEIDPEDPEEPQKVVIQLDGGGTLETEPWYLVKEADGQAPPPAPNAENAPEADIEEEPLAPWEKELLDWQEQDAIEKAAAKAAEEDSSPVDDVVDEHLPEPKTEGVKFESSGTIEGGTPGPESEDWAAMVDADGPYRWNQDNQKLRVGQNVIAAKDGKTYTIKKFENNNKGVVVTDASGKKYALHRKKLTIADQTAAAPEPTPETTSSIPMIDGRLIETVDFEGDNVGIIDERLSEYKEYAGTLSFIFGDYIGNSQFRVGYNGISDEITLFDVKNGKMLWSGEMDSDDTWGQAEQIQEAINKSIKPTAGDTPKATDTPIADIAAQDKEAFPTVEAAYDSLVTTAVDNEGLITLAKHGFPNSKAAAIQLLQEKYIVGDATSDDLDQAGVKLAEFPNPAVADVPGLFNSDEALKSIMADMPMNIPGVKLILGPGSTEYQLKQYRNAKYALLDAEKEEKGSTGWYNAVNKALFNLEHAGPEAQPKLNSVLDWKNKTIAAQNDAVEVDSDNGISTSKLPDGYTQPAPGATAVYTDGGSSGSSSRVYGVVGADGTVTFHYADGSVYHDGLAKEVDVKDVWEKIASDDSAPTTLSFNLPDGFAPVPPNAEAVYKYHDSISHSDIYAVVMPGNNIAAYYYSDGGVMENGTTVSNLEKLDIWTKVEPDASGSSLPDLPDGVTPAPPGTKSIYQLNSDAGVDDAAGVYAIISNDNKVAYHYKTGNVVPKPYSDPDFFGKSAMWTPYQGITTPEAGEVDLSKPHRMDADGNPMFVGDKVVALNGEEFTVHKFENNDVGVIVVNAAGKKFARNRKKLLATKKSALAPAAPVVKKPIVVTPKPVPEVDTSSPWYGEDKKPVAPALPEAIEMTEWVSAEWLPKAAENWKANTTSTTKTFETTVQYAQWKKVADEGDASALTWLKNEKFITDELYLEAEENIDFFNAEMEDLQDQYKIELQKFNDNLKLWNKANGIDPTSFPGAPKPTDKVYQGGAADWTSAPEGTPTAEAVLNAMSTADPDLARRGASIMTDAGDIEDLDIRVTRVLDVNGNDTMEAKFKLTGGAGEKIFNQISSRPDAKKEYAVTLQKRSTDKDTGLPKYLNSTSYTNSEFNAQTVTYTDPDTGVKVSMMRAGNNNGSWSNHTLNNRVTFSMPSDTTPEAFQKTLENLGVSQATPADPKSIEVLAKNKLLSIGANYYNSSQIPAPDSDEMKQKLAYIKSKYDVGPENVRVNVNALGRTEFVLDDESRDKIVKFASLGGFKHNMHDNNFDTWMNILSGPQSGLTATHVRWSEGLGSSGSSSPADMRSSGADYIFTTPLHGTNATAQSYGSSVVIHPNAVRRLDVWSNYSDEYGDHVQSYDDVWTKMSGQPYEVTWKHGVELRDIWYVNVSDSTIKQQIIQALKNKGIYEINGIPVEDFVLASNEKTPDINISTYSSNDLPVFGS